MRMWRIRHGWEEGALKGMIARLEGLARVGGGGRAIILNVGMRGGRLRFWRHSLRIGIGLDVMSSLFLHRISPFFNLLRAIIHALDPHDPSSRGAAL